MYAQSLVVILILFMFFFQYQKPNGCAFEITNSMSFNFESTNVKVNLTNKHIQPRIVKENNNKIPKRIVQTNQENSIPEKMIQTVNIILRTNQEYEYQFFNATQRRQFIKDNMGERVLRAYDKLVPKAFQADLWRYCVIYKKGGCYMDSGSYTVRGLDTVIGENDKFVSTIDAQGWGINSAFFCAIPQHPILNISIQDIVQDVQKQIYKDTPIQLTGPHRFENSFKKYLNISFDQILTPGSYSQNIQIFDRQVQIQCLIATLTDGITPFILSKYPFYYSDMKSYTHEPRYEELWRSKGVYNKITPL